MDNKIILSSEASRELQESYMWYESRSEGLGERFVELIDKEIKLIKLNPEGYPSKRAPYREIALGKFPYLIIYEYIKVAHVLYILHVFNTNKNPVHKYEQK